VTSDGTDQLIDPAMARALHVDACRDRALVAWAVLWDLPAYPERYAARLATSGQASSAYLLLADTLAGIREMLPYGLVRSGRMPGARRALLCAGMGTCGMVRPMAGRRLDDGRGGRHVSLQSGGTLRER
jgi:hypothetical protein